MFNIINKVICWIKLKDYKAKMAEAKRIDDLDDKWCNSAYKWLFNNF